MTLMERLNEDFIKTLKAQEKFTLSVLRMLKSALQLESINKKYELSDDEIISVIKKQVKIRKDSMNEYISYNRNDLADDLKKEIEILSSYLPEELDEESVRKIIDEVFDELKPTSIKDMGMIMKNLVPKLNNMADMTLVNGIIRSKLN